MLGKVKNIAKKHLIDVFRKILLIIEITVR